MIQLFTDQFPSPYVGVLGFALLASTGLYLWAFVSAPRRLRCLFMVGFGYTSRHDFRQSIVLVSLRPLVSVFSREYLTPLHFPHRMGTAGFLPSGFTRGDGRCTAIDAH